MNWTKIILHHSATTDSPGNDWEAIRKWHTGKIGSPDPSSPDFNPYIAKPDLDIGYHCGIEYVDGKLVVQTGRPLSMPGAHTIGQNQVAIGICLVGNYDKVAPNDEQYQAVADLCKRLMNNFNIPAAEIHGHREYAPKSCPGKLFSIDRIKELVQA